jgi:hypothetical protein
LEGGAAGVFLVSLSRLERELARGVIAEGDLGGGALGIAVTVATSGSVMAGVTGLGPWGGDTFVHVFGRVAWSFLLAGVAGLGLVGVDFFLLRLVMGVGLLS